MGMSDGRWASDAEMNRIEREQQRILADRKAASARKNDAPKGDKK